MTASLKHSPGSDDDNQRASAQKKAKADKNKKEVLDAYPRGSVSQDGDKQLQKRRDVTQKDHPMTVQEEKDVLLSGVEDGLRDTRREIEDGRKQETKDKEAEYSMEDIDDKQELQDTGTSKDILAIELMKDHNSSLQDVIQNYEDELSTLKNALGPNLVNLLLSKDKENEMKEDEMLATTDRSGKEEDELSDLRPTPVKRGERTDKADSIAKKSKKQQQAFDQDDDFGDEKGRAEHPQIKEDKQTKQAAKISEKIKDGELLEEGTDSDDEVLQSQVGRTTVPVHQQSEELKSILSPLLSGDKDTTIEDIVKTLSDDLKTLNDKLGPNLTKGLLVMNSEPRKALSEDKEIEADIEGSESDDQETNVRSRDKKQVRKVDETIGTIVSPKDSSGKVGRDKRLSAQKKTKAYKDEKEKDEDEQGKDDNSRRDEHVELAALVRISEKDETLEEIIKKYEETLDRYESALGPNLSKAILANQQGPTEPTQTSKEGQEREQSEDEVLDSEETPSEKHSSKTYSPKSKYGIRQHMLVSDGDEKLHLEDDRLQEPLRLLNKGDTLEDMLIDYEKEREMLNIIKTEDGSPISIDDITAEYKKQIRDLEKDNAAMRQDLNTLDAKLGQRLSDQLKGKETGDSDRVEGGKETETSRVSNKNIDAAQNVEKDSDTTDRELNEESGKKHETPRESNQQFDSEKERTEENYSTLEAPIIMMQNDQTLEDVIADYEAQLKDMLFNQEQMNAELDTLELGLGPKLFKELRELGVDEEMGLCGSEKEEIGECEDKAMDSPRKTSQSKSDFEAINKMTEEEKPLASVLEDYQNKNDLLEKENDSMRKALDSMSGDGGDIGDMIAGYENRIQMLENTNKEAEKDFEEKHNELQKEIDDLRDTLEKLAQTLRQDFLDDLIQQQDSDNRIEALQKMEKEKKTLAEVVEEYEDNMKRMEREKAVLEQLTGQSEDGASMLDTINDYEDSIQSLKDVNKMLNQRIDTLGAKIGPRLTEEITELCDRKEDKDKGTEKTKQTIAAVKKMEDDNVTLEEVLRTYEDQMKTLDGGGKDTDKNKQDKQQDKQHNADEVLKKLRERIGETLANDISELDNRSIEEFQNEDKRPFALWVMKKRNNKLADVIKLYEDYLLQYGIMDTIQGESLALELEEATGQGDISVDVYLNEPLVSEVMYEEPPRFDVLVEENVRMTGAMPDYDVGDDFRMTGAMPDYDVGDDFKRNDKEEQLAELQRQLEEEKKLNDKYQKDVQDLLNDIVKLKMKNTGDDGDIEDVERQIKEEYEAKQENQRLQEELAKLKDKNKELEKESTDLSTENKNMEKEIKRLEKEIEEMQKQMKKNLKHSDKELEKRTSKLDKRVDTLQEEIESLENQFKEKDEGFHTEKSSILDNADQEKKLHEQLLKNDELEEKLKEMDENSDKDDDRLAQLKMRNEALKEQLDHAEEAMREALGKYQEQIKCLETENAKTEEEKKYEIELLNNKLQLEKDAHERLKQDYEEILKKEKERMLEDFENDLEREKRRKKKDFDEQLEDFERLKKKHEQELEDMNEKSKKEKAELSNLFEQEKQQLQKAFDEKLKQQEEEHQRMIDKLRDELEDQMATQIAEITLRYQQERASLQVNIEKNIYGDEIQKNLDLESDFQGTLNKVLKDHASDIEDIERESKQAEECFKEQKYQLLKEFEKEREKDKKEQEKVRLELEMAIENMLKEIIKLKHQRKEMRRQHRIEKQNVEELFDSERMEIQSSIERSKNELISKVKEEYEKEMGYEREKYEAMIKELQEALEKAETKRKEVEETLRSEELKFQESRLNNESKEKPNEVAKEIKVIKRTIEIEYEQKLSIEKQRFEETLQGLRKEVGNLQEKRKIIQERVYNQDNYSAEKHVIEKSIANYKMEVLAKLEGEMAQRLDRERKPLEEDIKELQTENEELKSQRWEMKVQFRREKALIEEKYEKEKETMEENFNKEREEMRKRLEATLQKQEKAIIKSHEMRISRTASPEASPRIDNTYRMLQHENLSLVTQNARLEADVGKLTTKLDSMEDNFKELVQTEKTKAERVNKIQEDTPNTVSYKDVASRPAPEYQPPSTSAQDEAVFHSMQEKDHQIHQLLETKRYYESVLGELCDEAGLFELDRNQVV